VIVRWRGDRALADREGMATVYAVSERTVRRYCQPCDYDGPTRRALYDVLAWEETLTAILPRYARTVSARLARRSALDALR
jgi:hypothetical protein